MRRTIGWTALVLCVLGAVPMSSGSAGAMSCSPGPFIVFFEHDAAYLDKEAREILDNVAEAIGDCGNDHATLAGHTDTSENPRLARKRIDVVRTYIIAHGLPRGDIAVKSFGAKAPRIATGPNVKERQNRRVELFWTVG